jgi:UDPglucose 6-dehydrogenase
MNLAVIGTGYVGLVAGAGFADFGNDVSCVDIDPERVERLRRGEVPIHEPGLPELIGRNMRTGRLSFTTHLPEAVAGADVVLIAVGTPPTPDGSADLRQVLAAADGIGRALTGPAVVATKSTVPVGTAAKVRDAISAHARVPFAVASNPEFLKEGSAVEDFLRPMRVVLGVGPDAGCGLSDEQARTVLRRLYDPVVRTGDRLLFTDARSAELTKYAANAYLATRISFMNDLANLCEHLGADIEMVRRGMGMDTRIGPKFLFAGLGFGGSCFPKDVQALLSMARAHGRDLQIVAATTRINDAQRLVLLSKMERHFGGGPDAFAGRTVAVWGLSFKPETDREFGPDRGGRIRSIEPEVRNSV